LEINQKQDKICNLDLISSQESVDSGIGVSEDNEAAFPVRDYTCSVKRKIIAYKRRQVLKKIKKLSIINRSVIHDRNFVPWRQKNESFCEFSLKWIDHFEKLQIDDFADLNKAEKTFLYLWNQHVKTFCGLGLTHISFIVERFVDSAGLKLLEQNLYRNFIAHLCTLEKMAIIGSKTILTTTVQLQKLIDNTDDLHCLLQTMDDTVQSRQRN